MGRHGKFWHNVKCQCVRADWCPEKKLCPNSDLGERWDNRLCRCVESKKFECPTGMYWNSEVNQCQFTKEGCKIADCPSDKIGTWVAGECRCKLRREFCGRLECPMGKQPVWQDGCRCNRIPNFKPEKLGMCGPGMRWSTKRFACKPFNGCGPGRAWSNKLWKCVGTLKCPEGTKWHSRVG